MPSYIGPDRRSFARSVFCILFVFQADERPSWLALRWALQVLQCQSACIAIVGGNFPASTMGLCHKAATWITMQEYVESLLAGKLGTIKKKEGKCSAELSNVLLNEGVHQNCLLHRRIDAAALTSPRCSPACSYAASFHLLVTIWPSNSPSSQIGLPHSYSR